MPKVGEYYHFWDDGKLGLMRHYIARCEEIIPIKDASSHKFKHKYGMNMFDREEYDLLECWVRDKKDCDWLYAQRTDFIVKCSIPRYDEEPIFFARDKWGGWFSFETTGWWQGGLLDVDGSTYERVLENSSDELKEEHKKITY